MAPQQKDSKVKQPQQARSGPDGVVRSEKEERRINAVVVSVLGTTAGKEVMDYLRSISTNVAGGPNVTNDHLRHLEGMRYLTAILQSRIDAGHKEKA